MKRKLNLKLAGNSLNPRLFITPVQRVEGGNLVLQAKGHLCKKDISQGIKGLFPFLHSLDIVREPRNEAKHGFLHHLDLHFEVCTERVQSCPACLRKSVPHQLSSSVKDGACTDGLRRNSVERKRRLYTVPISPSWDSSPATRHQARHVLGGAGGARWYCVVRMRLFQQRQDGRWWRPN